MGPLNDRMKQRRRQNQGDVKYDIAWTTLAEYLVWLEKRGISQNIVSFIGAATIREHVIGLEDKPPTAAQLDEMRELVRREMEQGALGITTALIYPPAFFAKTEELIELYKVAAKYKGEVHDTICAAREISFWKRCREQFDQPRGEACQLRFIISRHPASRIGRRWIR